MNTMKICSGCQKPLVANAPDGLCPACLVKAGLGTGVDLGPDSQAESGQTPFVAPSLEEVARLFPQLEILGFIGQGGMGAVYKARQKSLDRVVALKILPPGIGKDAAFAERFTREAKALAKLNHTGIVTLYEFGQADGLFFFLMEFVDGMNLRHLMEVERISAREALAIVPQICDALQYAHDQGIVHRDIKPENILLDRQGRVKVADFGLAKLVGTDALTPALSHPMGEGGASAPVEGTPPSAALTDAGKVMGTPQYMAPEQRDHPTEVDHRADIYSLGVVFYQMLTGELPGKPIEAPSHKVHIDVRLDEVVLRALEKEPQRRYQQVSQVRTAVEMIATTSPPPNGSGPTLQADASHTDAQALGDKLSPWGRIVGIALNGTLTSPLAIKLVNISALGFLGALALLGFLPFPGMRGCFGFVGFCGFFGLIGVASIIEYSYRRKGGGSAAMEHGFVIVGRRSGKAVIHWPGVLLSFVLTLATAEAAAIIGSWVLMERIDVVPVGMVFAFAMMLMAILIVRGRATPVEQLTPLDGPGGAGLNQPGREWPMPLVGLRNGQRVIHWPGLLLFAAVFVATAGVFSLIFYWLLPVKGYAPHPRGLVVGLVVGFILLTIRLRQAWTAPIEKLPVLDGPERPHTAWPWIGAAVGIGLLVPVAVTIGFLFLGYSPTVGTVRQESPNRVLEVRCEGRKAYIQAELDGRHELHLFIGSEELGWSPQHTGSTSVTATVEASSQIKMEDRSMGRGLIFQAWGVRLYIAITPDGPVPYGEVVFRADSMITQKDATFTFADIRQADGTLIPVSIRVRPVPGNSMLGRISGPARGFDGGVGGGMGRAAGGLDGRQGGGMGRPVESEIATPSSGPVIERVVVGADRATLEGQGRPGFSLVLSVGDTTNRWECPFPNDTRFTAMFKGATRQGYSWAVSDRAGKVLFATGVPGFMGRNFNQAEIVFREGTLAPEPDGSFVIAWGESGNGGLVPMRVRLEKVGESAGVLTTTVFQLRNTQASNAVAALHPRFSLEFKIVADPRKNALIVYGPSNKLEALEQALQEIDSAKPPKSQPNTN